MVKIEKIVSVKTKTTLGEAPHWDVATKSLFFVDITKGTVHKYTPTTNEYYQADTGLSHVSAIVPVKRQRGNFVIVSENRAGIITWDGKSTKIAKFEPTCEIDIENNSVNDAKCDSSGRLWTGTMRKEILKGDLEGPLEGSLFSITNHKLVRKHYSPIGIANGLAWSIDNKKMFYIDSQQGIVLSFDFGLHNASAVNPKILFSNEKANMVGLLDGMTIDTDGNLWIAVNGAGIIIKIDPIKPHTILQTVNLPFNNPTSVAFGGKDLDELYVTSTQVIFVKGTKATEDDGFLFKITDLGVRGVQSNDFKLETGY